MSYWCEKCTRLNYGDEKCDFCGHIKKNNTKTWEIPKTKKVKISSYKDNRVNKKISLNKNTILIAGIVVIAISVSYLAFQKYSEKREMEKALQYMTGYDNVDEYMKASSKEKLKRIDKSKMMKDTDIILKESFKKQTEIFNKMLDNK